MVCDDFNEDPVPHPGVADKCFDVGDFHEVALRKDDIGDKNKKNLLLLPKTKIWVSKKAV